MDTFSVPGASAPRACDAGFRGRSRPVLLREALKSLVGKMEHDVPGDDADADGPENEGASDGHLRPPPFVTLRRWRVTLLGDTLPLRARTTYGALFSRMVTSK